MNNPGVTRIADDVRALLQPSTTHASATRIVPVPRPELWEQIRVTHSVTHAPLLDQVRDTVTNPVAVVDRDAFHTAPKSKPAAQLDALAFLRRLEVESTRWAQALRSRVRVPLESRLSGLVGAAAMADAQLVGDLGRAVHGWVIGARIVTGWEKAPWAPNVQCPNTDCERRGTLRIRLDTGVGQCMECGTYWDADNIRVLGDYIRWAGEHLTGPRHWRVDADGFPVECVECLATREQMALRAAARSSSARLSA